MAEAITMKMVITLKSGVQIKVDVEDFKTGRSQIFGELRDLTWTPAERPDGQLGWLDIGEIAAIHAEYGYATDDNHG